MNKTTIPAAKRFALKLGTAAVMGLGLVGASHAADPEYFSKYEGVHMSRDAKGVLLMELNTNGGPLKFTARNHEQFVDAFYAVSRDRANKIVILTGKGGQWVPDIDFGSFGDVSDPDVWSKVHDEGTQVIENISNIRVPMICAVEGKAWVHSEYCLMADVIVAGAGATFHDTPHFAGGIVPGDGMFTVWSYRVGPTHAQHFLLDPKPISAATAMAWGAVSEVVPDGKAVARANELATQYMTKPEVTLRDTRVIFSQPLKLALVQQVGYGLSLEGASASALVKSFKTK